MRVQITRWGNSLGVRVPKQLAREIGLIEGSQVDVEAADHRIIITPARPRYRLADLLKDTTPETYRAASVDWGPDVGREIVD
jgi:antitoxin MazE